MSDYIKDVISNDIKLDWAFPLQRTGAFPLDRSSLFSSYDDALLYATGGNDSRNLSGSSYIGQIISVYNEDENTISLYVIDTDRTLTPIKGDNGSTVSIKGDELSIEIIDNEVQIKDFGKWYYAFVPSSIDEETGEVIPSSYVYTEGFKAGLEARVTSNIVDDEIVYSVGWFEPSSETTEDLSARIESISKQVDDLEQTKADKSLVYTKKEVNDLITSVNVIERKIVSNINDINATDPKSQKYIYMVPNNKGTNNIYNEYMVVGGQVELIGGGEADLSGYITTKEVHDLLDEKVDKKTSLIDGTPVPWTLLSPEDKSKLDLLKVDKVGILVQAEQVSDLPEWIEKNRDNVPGLFTTQASVKLGGIQEGAEKNFIRSVDTGSFDVDSKGHLTLKNGGSSGTSLFTSVSKDFVIIEETKTLALAEEYVTKSVYSKEVGNLNDLVRASGNSTSTLVEEVNYINERLQWGEI